MNHSKNTILNYQTYQKSFLPLILARVCTLGIYLYSVCSWGKLNKIPPFFPDFNLTQSLEISAQLLKWSQDQNQLTLQDQVRVKQGKWILRCDYLTLSFTAKKKLSI